MGTVYRKAAKRIAKAVSGGNDVVFIIIHDAGIAQIVILLNAFLLQKCRDP